MIKKLRTWSCNTLRTKPSSMPNKSRSKIWRPRLSLRRLSEQIWRLSTNTDSLSKRPSSRKSYPNSLKASSPRSTTNRDKLFRPNTIKSWPPPVLTPPRTTINSKSSSHKRKSVSWRWKTTFKNSFPPSKRRMLRRLRSILKRPNKLRRRSSKASSRSKRRA